jgi:hypothetical protein
MACKIKQRKDDIPKRKGEKSWVCETCDALIFSKAKPRCRLEVQAEMEALHAAAEAELDSINRRKKA